MSPDELEAELAGGRLRPAYLLVGSEALLREDARRAIEAAALGDAPRDFDLDRLEGDACTPAVLEDSLRVLPVLAPHRLVILREPEARRRGGEALGARLGELVGELRDPPETVLVAIAEKLDGRARWPRAFAGAAARIECEAPRTARELATIVRREAKRPGVSLAGGAAEALADRVGPQLLLLRQEIAKAALFAGPGKPVGVAHVSEIASDAAEEPIWSLTDAIGEGRIPDALAHLAQMQAAGAPPMVLLGSLASHFRKLARIRAGGSIGGSPFAQKKLEAQARRYALPQLRACLRALHEADERLKGRGALTPELTLERLLMTLGA